MNIIFMTNSDFSFHSLDILVKSNHKILSVVTNPPEEIGRQKKNTSNIILMGFLKESLRVLQKVIIQAQK